MSVTALLKRRMLLALCLLFGGFAFAGQAQQAELGKCSLRPRVIQRGLFVDNKLWCVENVVDDSQIEPMAFTALEVAPDGTLYATRPLTGQIMAIRDTDHDDLPDAMEIFASGLTLPNGLAYHQGALYVAGGPNIYRISDAGAVRKIAADLPSGTGFWTGGLAVGDDNRLYAAVGAPCENCEFDEPQRGAILGMALDGSDRQVVAFGFRQPADVSFYRGQLWTLDSSPRAIQHGALDELNLVEPGGWYGFPYCLGKDSINLPSDDIDCKQSIQPRLLFGSGATPTSLAAYPHATLPGTEDTLIVVLGGEPTQVDFVGYKVVMIHFDEDNQPLGVTLLIPYRYESLKQAFEPYRGDGYFSQHIITLSEQGWGIFPQQPLAVAVNSRGWIYISLTGGQIIALRPTHELPSDDDRYPIWTPQNPNYDPRAAPAIPTKEAQGD